MAAFDPHTMNLLLLLKQLSVAFDYRMMDSLRSEGLHSDDMLLLAFLEQERAYGPQDLAWLVGRPRQSVHRSLTRLIRRGYVNAAPAALTQRNVWWALTPAGREVWARVKSQIIVEEGRLGFGPESTRSLAELLRDCIARVLPFNPDAKSGLEPWVRRVARHDW